MWVQRYFEKKIMQIPNPIGLNWTWHSIPALFLFPCSKNPTNQTGPMLGIAEVKTARLSFGGCPSNGRIPSRFLDEGIVSRLNLFEG